MFHAFIFLGSEIALTSIEKTLCVLEDVRIWSNKTIHGAFVANSVKKHQLMHRFVHGTKCKKRKVVCVSQRIYTTTSNGR